MVENKYIGLLLAMTSSLAVGTSTVVQKMGLNAAGSGQATSTEDMSYLRNPVWWLGFTALIVGEAFNFAAYTFAPPVMVTPLGAFSVIIGAIFASVLLKERLGHLGRVGCALCLLGTLIIVLHAPEDQDLQTATQFLEYAIQPGFLLYCFAVVVFSIVMGTLVAPTHGRKSPLVYISIASLVGSVSVMFLKGFGLAIKLTFGGHNQFGFISTWLFGAISTGCMMVQLHYSNRALDIFSVNLVNPVYYVGFCTATIVASFILFRGFNTADAPTTISLLCGFAITFLGVHVLNVAMLDEAAAAFGEGRRRGSVEERDRWRVNRTRRTGGMGLFGGLRAEGMERLLEDEEEEPEVTPRASIRITPRPV